jgi:hypothetical protein
MEEERSNAQRTEDRRLFVAIASTAIASALQGLAASGTRRRSLPLALRVLMIGGYGGVTCMKLYEREQSHITRARSLRNQLAQYNPDAHIERDLTDAANDHRSRHAVLTRIRLNTILLSCQAVIACWRLVDTAATLLGSTKPDNTALCLTSETIRPPEGLTPASVSLPVLGRSVAHGERQGG